MLNRSLQNRFVLSSLLALNLIAFSSKGADKPAFDIVEVERPRIMAKAAEYLSEPPVTVTASHSPRSAGGLHDFFSEGDYWWPDPQNPDGPNIATPWCVSLKSSPR
jgi:hypothetical protein